MRTGSHWRTSGSLPRRLARLPPRWAIGPRTTIRVRPSRCCWAGRMRSSRPGEFGKRSATKCQFLMTWSATQGQGRARSHHLSTQTIGQRPDCRLERPAQRTRYHLRAVHRADTERPKGIRSPGVLGDRQGRRRSRAVSQRAQPQNSSRVERCRRTTPVASYRRQHREELPAPQHPDRKLLDVEYLLERPIDASVLMAHVCTSSYSMRSTRIAVSNRPRLPS